MTRWKSALTLLIGVLIFAWSIHYLGTSFQWRDIGTVLSHAQLGSFVLGATLTTLLYWALRAWRWQVLLSIMKSSIMNSSTIPALSIYMSTACSLAFALITPFQSGELLKVELLRKHGALGRFDGYATFAVERFLDLLVVVSLAFTGVLLDATWGLSPRLLGTFALAMLIAVGIVWAVCSWSLNHRVRELKLRLAQLTAQPTRLAFASLLTLAAWLTVALGWAWCLTCIGITLPPVQAVTLTTGMTLVNVLSFIPGAVGVSEAGIAVALTHLGHSSALAQSGALLIRAYGLAALVLGLLHFIVWQRIAPKSPTP